MFVPAKPSTHADHGERARRAREYLEQHLDDAAPSDLARLSAYSLHHFHRVFRGVTGESVVEYQRRLRLERAARRLRNTERGIMEVALDAGYDSHEAFTRAFRAMFGATPSECRLQPSERLESFLQTSAGAAPAVEIRVVEPIRVAYLRVVGSYEQIGAAFDRLMGIATQRGLATAPRFYGLCPDDPEVTPEDRLRFDVCIAVPDAHKPDEQLGVRAIPGGTYGVLAHRGSFTTLAQTYLLLIGRWLPSTRYDLADEPVVEAYISDPEVTPEAERVTEVWARLDDSGSVIGSPLRDL